MAEESWAGSHLMLSFHVRHCTRQVADDFNRAALLSPHTNQLVNQYALVPGKTIDLRAYGRV
eukprot:SAG31_NODE_4251_length_3417_cov_48.105787_3_plen_62_part_00